MSTSFVHERAIRQGKPLVREVRGHVGEVHTGDRSGHGGPLAEESREVQQIRILRFLRSSREGIGL